MCLAIWTRKVWSTYSESDAHPGINNNVVAAMLPTPHCQTSLRLRLVQSEEGVSVHPPEINF